MTITERAKLDFANLPFTYWKTDANLRYTWRDGKWGGEFGWRGIPFIGTGRT